MANGDLSPEQVAALQEQGALTPEIAQQFTPSITPVNSSLGISDADRTLAQQFISQPNVVPETRDAAQQFLTPLEPTPEVPAAIAAPQPIAPPPPTPIAETLLEDTGIRQATPEELEQSNLEAQKLKAEKEFEQTKTQLITSSQGIVPAEPTELEILEALKFKKDTKAEQAAIETREQEEQAASDKQVEDRKKELRAELNLTAPDKTEKQELAETAIEYGTPEGEEKAKALAEKVSRTEPVDPVKEAAEKEKAVVNKVANDDEVAAVRFTSLADVFDKGSVGQQIGAAIAIALGSLGQGLAGGKNQAIQTLDKIFNANVQHLKLEESQKAALRKQFFQQQAANLSNKAFALKNEAHKLNVTKVAKEFADEAKATAKKQEIIAASKIGGDNTEILELDEETSKRLKQITDFVLSKEKTSNIDALAKSFQQVKALGSSVSATNDLALIFSIMKTLDPASVVREGEFAKAAESGSVIERMKAQYNKLVGGELLSDKIRQDFVNTAKTLMVPALKEHQKLNEQAFSMAQAQNVPQSAIRSSVKDFSSILNESKTPKLKFAEQIGKLAPGVTLKDISKSISRLSKSGEIPLMTFEIQNAKK